jgi:hypothetical protein
VLLETVAPTRVLGGMDVLAAVRARYPGLPLVLSSGFSAESLPEGTVGDGVTTVLRKPYAAGELMAAVHLVLAAPTTR